MALAHQNDPELIKELLADPGIWVIVGLNQDTEKDAYTVARWLGVELAKGIIPVHPEAETVLGNTGYASLADIPTQDIKVVDCFVSNANVGAVVDEAIEHKDRLQIDAIWMQKGVVDEAAAERARAAGLGVVMDTCPKIEWAASLQEGSAR
jgi:predicted CoA-binding protein